MLSTLGIEPGHYHSGGLNELLLRVQRRSISPSRPLTVPAQ